MILNLKPWMGNLGECQMILFIEVKDNFGGMKLQRTNKTPILLEVVFAVEEQCKSPNRIEKRKIIPTP